MASRAVIAKNVRMIRNKGRASRVKGGNFALPRKLVNSQAKAYIKGSSSSNSGMARTWNEEKRNSARNILKGYKKLH